MQDCAVSGAEAAADGLVVSTVHWSRSAPDLSGGLMPYAVDFETVSTVGLDSSPVAAALAGPRAHEAR